MCIVQYAPMHCNAPPYAVDSASCSWGVIRVVCYTAPLSMFFYSALKNDLVSMYDVQDALTLSALPNEYCSLSADAPIYTL